MSPNQKIPGIKVYQVDLHVVFSDLEIIAVDISDTTSTLPFRLVAVYRPPSYILHYRILFTALSH